MTLRRIPIIEGATGLRRRVTFSLMQRFSCECGNILFFSSSRCLGCGSTVGYDPASEQMHQVKPGSPLVLCENGVRHGVCNWLVPAGGRRTLCVACRANRTIPDLGIPRNLTLWARMEAAKRRLLYTLLRRGLRVPSQAEDPRGGLAFDILSTVANPAVTTGHLNGVITLNLEEADDTYRQINREQLGETNRTLLRHFRHESGHYVWYRNLSGLPANDPLRAAFRDRFGDEMRDYAAALTAYYNTKSAAPPPPPGADPQPRHITPYAASHPWEDWAETWAHYLQIIDGLETCEELGIHVQHLALPLILLPGEAGALPAMLPQNGIADGEFLALLQRWLCLSTVLNEVSESLGEPALYPFVISSPVAQKLRLAHHYAQVWAGR